MSSPNWWGDWRPTLTPHTGNLLATDLIECTMIVGGLPVNTVITGAQILGAVPTPSVAWGSITGTLSSQTDLNTALSGKASTGAVTGTGITMSTASILGRSTSGTGAIEEITIGTGLTLSAGTLTASGGGLTVGTTAITSGTIGRVLFQGTGNVLQQSANLFWDNTNSRLGIGTASPNMSLDVRTGNVGIGVTSNAGYKLDVNGTARVQGNLDVTGSNILTTRYLNINSVGQGARIEYTYSGGTLVQLGRMQGTTGTNRQFDIISKTPDYGVTSQQILTLFPSASIKYSNAAAVSTTVATETASACFEVESTTKGFLPPRMTTTQKNAIASPAAGLVVYDTTLNKLCVRTASAWETITSL